jgi:hypothetical protein
MKRSEKLNCWAGRERGLALMFLSAGCAGCVWAVRAWQSSGTGGFLLLVAALAVLRLGVWHWQESRRLGWLAKTERLWESRLMPRI